MIKLIIDKNIPISEESFEGQNIDFDFLPFDKINSSTIKNADALFIRTTTKVNKELISKSNISFIGSFASGENHISNDLLDDSECLIQTAKGSNSQAVFEYVLSCILENDFDTLWNILWKHYDINKFKKEYNLSKTKFNKLKNGFISNNQFIDFNYIIKNSINNKVNYNDTEWEFPKGRRNRNENNINCAIREFEEESGFARNNIELINNKSYEEIYIAVNNILSKAKICVPKLITNHYKHNIIEISDLGKKSFYRPYENN